MKFKKILTILGIIVMSTSLVACGETTTKSSTKPKKETAAKEDKKKIKEENLTEDEKTLKEIVETTYFGNYEIKEMSVTEGYDGKDKRINLLLDAKSVKESLELSQAKLSIDYIFADIPESKEIYIGISENNDKKMSIQIDREIYESVDWLSLDPENLPEILGRNYNFKN